MRAILDRLPPSRTRAGWALLLFPAASPFFGASLSLREIDKARDTQVHDYGENLLKSVPPHSVLFADADKDYFPLCYLQQVEHRRPDVRTIPGFTLFESWGVKQVERLYPVLGLAVSPGTSPDPFARIIGSLTRIVAQIRGRRPVAFSYFDGAFHRYYLTRHPFLRFHKSGVALVIQGRSLPPPVVLPPAGLRLRNFRPVPADFHPALGRIRAAYRAAGLFP